MPRSVKMDPSVDLLRDPIRAWFLQSFPAGPTPSQSLAWPAIDQGKHLLLVAPTGTGKTLAAFLAILSQLHDESARGTLRPGLRCVYVSPLKSLGYDIERNLNEPLDAVRKVLGLETSPIRVGVRTGDTSPTERRKLRDQPPHLLITTPESLSLMLSQSAWHPCWSSVRHLVVDEVHALVANKRGADLAVTLERLSAKCELDPQRIGLSATCRPTAPVARYLVGPNRVCTVSEAGAPQGTPPLELRIESLQKGDEGPNRGLSYRRLIDRLAQATRENRTTIVFANTRAFTEKITHDLRKMNGSEPDSIAAHHSALDATRRRTVEASLKAGQLKAVVTSTSLELGVDIGTADQTVLVGLPGGVSRCLQRVGRSGHSVDSATRGLILAATPAELAGAVVTVEAARHGRVEPLQSIQSPLDVLCQQLIGMACGDEWSADDAFDLVRRATPMETLSRADFDACLDFLAGDLPSPPGAYEPEPGSTPRWTSPRIWKSRGLFAIRSKQVIRWFWSNVGTITSEESVRVQINGTEVGTLEGAYAERLQPGDTFLLDGRAWEFRRLEGLTVHARPVGTSPDLPRWTSDRQGLSTELARDLAKFRADASRKLQESASALRSWLVEDHDLDPDAAAVLEALFEAQEAVSVIPPPAGILIEQSPHPEGVAYTFHAPLGRSACEALGRAIAARLGKRFGLDLGFLVADLGWQIRLPEGAILTESDFPSLCDPRGFNEDVLEGLDRGELPARRFRHVASTAMMVLRNPEGGRTRVGGMLWVSKRLYPLVKAACPSHPLLKETRREVLEDLLDAPTALRFLESRPEVRLRVLHGLSPFAVAWIDPAGVEALQFESPADALRRLHARLVGI